MTTTDADKSAEGARMAWSQVRVGSGACGAARPSRRSSKYASTRSCSERFRHYEHPEQPDREDDIEGGTDKDTTGCSRCPLWLTTRKPATWLPYVRPLLQLTARYTVSSRPPAVYSTAGDTAGALSYAG